MARKRKNKHRFLDNSGQPSVAGGQASEFNDRISLNAPNATQVAANLKRSKRRRRNRKRHRNTDVKPQDPSVPPADGSSPFMTLPAEVRNEIYKVLFGGLCRPEVEIHFQQFPHPDRHEFLSYNLSNHLDLLSTCKLLRREAWPVLASFTSVHITGEQCWHELPPHLCVSLLPNVKNTKLSGHCADCIPNLTLLEMMTGLKGISIYTNFRMDRIDYSDRSFKEFALYIAGAKDKELMERYTDEFKQMNDHCTKNWAVVEMCESRGIVIDTNVDIFFDGPSNNGDPLDVQVKIAMDPATCTVQSRSFSIGYDEDECTETDAEKVRQRLETIINGDDRDYWLTEDEYPDLDDVLYFPEDMAFDDFADDIDGLTYDGVPLEAFSESTQNHLLSL